MAKRSKYVATRNDRIAPKRDKVTNPVPAQRAKLGGTDYGSVQVTQAMETSTATGQKVATQVVAVSETQLDPNVNKEKVINPFGGNSSYAPKGSGTYGGL